MGVGEVALVEEVGQDADDVVVVLGLIAVDPVVQLVATPGDLGVDEPAAVGVVEGLIGDADPGDAGQLAVPEARHVREVLVEGTSGGQRGGARPRVGAPEAVGSDHVVVIDRGVRGHRIGGRIERHQSRGSLGVGLNDVVRRVRHRDPAVDGDKGGTGENHPVGELGDRDPGAVPAERRDLRGEVAVGVGPGGRGAVVDAEAVVLVEAVLDEEHPAEAGDDALLVALPADLRPAAVGAGEGVGGGSDAQGAVVLARWPTSSRGQRRVRCRRGAAGGSGANPAGEPIATIRATAAAVIPANMAETLARRPARRFEPSVGILRWHPGTDLPARIGHLWRWARCHRTGTVLRVIHRCRS